MNLTLRVERETKVLLIILILALLLRVWRMWDWPLILSEANVYFYTVDMIKGAIPFYDSSFRVQHGPMMTYVLAPSVYLFGNNLFFVRLPFVILSVFSVFLLYTFTKKYYDKNVALLAAFILATTPNDVLNSSTAISIVLVPVFILLALNAFQKFTESRKNRNIYLYVFSFILGLGFITRISFLFFIIAFVLTTKFSTMSAKNIIKGRRSLLYALLFFLLATSPFVYYNLTNDFPAINFFKNNFPTTTEGVNLLDSSGNIFNGFFTFTKFMDESSRFSINQEFLAGNHYYLSILFFISLFIFIKIPLAKFFDKKKFDTFSKASRKNLYIFLNFSILFILISTITTTSFYDTEFMMLFPFYAMIVSWSLISLIRMLKMKVFHALILVALIFSPVLIIFVTNVDKNFAAIKSEGCDEIIPLLMTYSENNRDVVLVFDATTNLQTFRFYKPDANADTLMFYTYNAKQFYETIIRYVNDKNAVFIFVKDECNESWIKGRGVYENFVNYLEQNNKTSILQQVPGTTNVTILPLQILKLA
ncbi:MAG: glycosyltransferase family 39 protein [Candidatus Aenigmarchaeota archaeon]|nr:glycosyltransferase family 39 protein [Candidatus Aenigmarchaeota archaeon]